MIDQITLIKRIWKIGAVVLAVTALVFGGLFWLLGVTLASSEDWEDSAGETSCVSCGGNVNVNTNTNENKNKQEQTQENNQTVEITQNLTQTTQVPAVATAVPTQQPVTGPNVLGMALSLGALPLGLAFARFGRGRLRVKKEESLTTVADRLVELRRQKTG